MTKVSTFWATLNGFPLLVQIFLLLCQAVGMIHWPRYLLWSPVLVWSGIVLFLAGLMILMAIIDGGGRRRA